MRKNAGFMKAAGCMLLLLSLAGCAYSDILDQIPRDFAFPAGESQEVFGGQSRDSAEASQEVPRQLAQGPAQAPQTLPRQQSRDTDRDETEAGWQGTFSDETFLAEEAGDYACRALNGAERIWYHEIEQILGGFGEKVRLSGEGLQAGLTEGDIDRIFQCVLNDHPELFYVEGYSYSKYTRGGTLTAVEFSGTYSMDRETALLRRQEIEDEAAEILAGISPEASDYDKVKYVYETLIKFTDYELQSPDNQNIYSVLVNHKSVCQGYAKASQYLLDRLGVECTLVLGTVEGGEGHAWNLVKVDGSYYYVDTTWGDASYQLGDAVIAAGFSMPAINYDYLNITTRELQRTHVIGGEVPMPECTANEANYYVREGAWFDSCDIGRIKGLFDRASESGRADVTVKCADAACYGEMAELLIGEQKIFDFWAAAGSHIAYAQNENQLSLTFWMTND